jgi:alkylation response protein AidB-like acyl-CoA dehydrogenase
VDFTEPAERSELRRAVAGLASRYGTEYYRRTARAGETPAELWKDVGERGYLGVNIPAAYGGGGGGVADLAAVLEEMAAAGCPLLLMVVSPAICATVISRYGTEQQKCRWLPGMADGHAAMAFAITEPDAGSNAHRLKTTARPDGAGYVLNGQKIYISCVDQADAVLVVARMQDSDTGKLAPALFMVPTGTPGLTVTRIEMDVAMPDHQFQLFFDELRLPTDALLGGADQALPALFAGLNPERIMAAHMSLGTTRHALNQAVAYAKDRSVFGAPIGAHQAVSHPLAQLAVELESTTLLAQQAAAAYDVGDDQRAGEVGNMAKYAAGELVARAVDQAIQTHGGNGLAAEYGLAAQLAGSRLARIAPVSREMVLNFVAEHTLGLRKSY